MPILKYNGLTVSSGGSGSLILPGFGFAEAGLGIGNPQIYFQLPVGKSIRVMWGDGASDIYDGIGAFPLDAYHTYTDGRRHTITLAGDYLDLIDIYVINNIGGDISGWATLTNLTEVGLDAGFSGVQLYGDVSGFSVLTNLTGIDLHASNVTGDISGWRTLTGLTGSFALYMPGTLVTFESNTAWTGIDADVYLNDCLLSGSNVDNALIAFSGGSFANKTINLGGTNDSRTSASNAALAILQGNGCTVTVN